MSGQTEPFTYDYRDGNYSTVGIEELFPRQSRHDDLRIIDRFIEYDKKDQDKVAYLTYLLNKREDDGEWMRIVKVVKLCKVYNVPKELREMKALMVSQDELLSSLWKNDTNFICIYCNMPENDDDDDEEYKKSSHGFFYCYGVQCVMPILPYYHNDNHEGVWYDENTAEEDKIIMVLNALKKQADAQFGGLVNLLRGNFRQSQFLNLTMKEAESIRKTIEEAPQLQVIRGIPHTHISSASGVTTSMTGITTTPDGIEQNEEFIRGLLHERYANVIMAVPIPYAEILQWSQNTAKELSKYKSQYSGMISHNAGISIPMVFAGNLSATMGNTQGVTDTTGETLGTTEGTSDSYSHGVGTNQGTSHNLGLTNGQSVGVADSVSQANTNSASQGLSNSHSLTNSNGVSMTESNGVTHGVSNTESMGRSHTVGTSESYSEGDSITQSRSHSLGKSTTMSHTLGETLGTTEGVTRGITHGITDGTSLTQGHTIGQTQGHTVGNTQGLTYGHTVGNTTGQTITDGFSNGTSHTLGHSNTTSNGISNTNSYGQSIGNTNTMGHTVGTTSGYSDGTSHTVGSSNTVTDGSTVTHSSSHGINDGYSNTLGQTVSEGLNGGLKAGIGPIGGNIGGNVSTGVNIGEGLTHGVSDTFSDSNGTTHSVSNGHTVSDGTTHTNSNSWSNANSFSQGLTNTNTTSHSMGNTMTNAYGTSISDGTTSTNSHSVGNSTSHSISDSTSRSNSHSVSDSLSNSVSDSLSKGLTHSVSNSNSLSNSFSNSHSLSNSYGLSQGVTEGFSEGVSRGKTWGHSVGNTVSDGITKTVAHGTTDSNSHTMSNGLTRSQSIGESIGKTNTLSQGESTGLGKTANQGLSKSLSDTQGVSSGNSISDSRGTGTTSSKSNALSSAQGLSVAKSNALGMGQSTNFSFGPNVGVSRSYQIFDERKGNLIKLLEVCNDRWNLAAQSGAFHVDAYVVSYTPRALQSIAMTSVTSWGGKNDIASIQCVTPDEFTQNHLMKHISVFEPCTMKENIPNVADNYLWSTIMLTSELSAMTHLPRVETGGISTVATNIPSFSVFANKNGEIYFGKQINYEDGKPSYDYYFSKQEFMHTLVCGASGSGKTTSAVRIAREVIRNYKDMKIFALDWKNSWRVLKRFATNGIDDFEFYGMDSTSVRPIRMNLFIPPKHATAGQWVDRVIESLCLGYGFGNKMYSVIQAATQMVLLLEGIYLFDENNAPKEFTPLNQKEQDEYNRRIANVSLDKVFLVVQAMKNADGKGNLKATCPKQIYEELEDKHFKNIISDEVYEFIKTKLLTKSGMGMNDAYDSILSKLEAYYSGSLRKMYCHNVYEECVHIEDLIDGKRIVVLEGGDLDSSSKKAIIGMISWGMFMYSRLKKNRDKIVEKRFYILEEAHRIIDNPQSGNAAPLDVGETIFDIILNEAREYGVYAMIIVQAPSELPPAMVTNCSILIIHRLGNDKDITLMTQLLCRNARLDNRDVPIWLAKEQLGTAIVRISNAVNHQDSEPCLVQVARCPNDPPDNEELVLEMDDVEIPFYIRQRMNDDEYLQKYCKEDLEAFADHKPNSIDAQYEEYNDDYRAHEVNVG